MLLTENTQLSNMQITYVLAAASPDCKAHEIFHIHHHSGYVWTEVVSVTLQTKSVPGRFWKRK